MNYILTDDLQHKRPNRFVMVPDVKLVDKLKRLLERSYDFRTESNYIQAYTLAERTLHQLDEIKNPSDDFCAGVLVHFTEAALKYSNDSNQLYKVYE